MVGSCVVWAGALGCLAAGKCAHTRMVTFFVFYALDGICDRNCGGVIAGVGGWREGQGGWVMPCCRIQQETPVNTFGYARSALERSSTGSFVHLSTRATCSGSCGQCLREQQIAER